MYLKIAYAKMFKPIVAIYNENANGVTFFLYHIISLGPEVITSFYSNMADVGKTPVARNEKTNSEFGYVGIDAILEQMRRKAMKQGFEFNIMVVGK